VSGERAAEGRTGRPERDHEVPTVRVRVAGSGRRGHYDEIEVADPVAASYWDTRSWHRAN
jgi:hypothetical protein